MRRVFRSENLLLHCLQPIREKLINQPKPKIHPKVLFLAEKISTFIETDKRIKELLRNLKTTWEGNRDRKSWKREKFVRCLLLSDKSFKRCDSILKFSNSFEEF